MPKNVLKMIQSALKGLKNASNALHRTLKYVLGDLEQFKTGVKRFVRYLKCALVY